MNADWASYDSAAESHDRVAVRIYFARPAADLVADCDVASASDVLDVGTGSGIVAVRARDAAPHARITGVDPSIEMLRIARTHGVPAVVAGSVPGLPFADRRFDRVLAGFVIAHVPSYQEALADMARVLAPGGRLGVTAWGALENPHRELWSELARAAVGPQALQQARQNALPWEDRFSSQDHVGKALQDAGLKDITVRRALYGVETTTEDFLAQRENSIHGRFVRHSLDFASWERFQEMARTEFAKRFPDPLTHTRDVLIAVGTRP
jgi:ubiquinone/menaquinone biosynthesis C-methylase UbiE